MKVFETIADPQDTFILREANARVARGVKVLAAHDAEWFTKVNPDTLRLALGNVCVIGQLSGEVRSYHTGVEQLFGVDSYNTDDQAWLASLGFVTAPNESPLMYDALDIAWKKVLFELLPKRTYTVTETFVRTFELEADSDYDANSDSWRITKGASDYAERNRQGLAIANVKVVAPNGETIRDEVRS